MQDTEVDVFDAYARVVRDTYAMRIAGSDPVFTTDATDLDQVYLNSFSDPAERQHHNCSACKHFLRRYGHLVAVNANGVVRPLLWDHDAQVPELFKPAHRAMWAAVSKARITGVFLSELTWLGTPENDGWHHFAVKQPTARVFQRRLLSARQRMAELKPEFLMLLDGLRAFKATTFDTAAALLSVGGVNRADKFKPVADTLMRLRAELDGGQSQYDRDAKLWYAVATAPAGTCHVKGSVFGTLLEDIEKGVDTQAAIRSFNTKVDPLNYMRATVAPTAGNVQQAEKLVAQMGLAPAFERRVATLAEVAGHAVWQSTHEVQGTAADPAAKPPATGMFAGLTGQSPGAQSAGSTTMTWEKFRTSILPMATAIKALGTDREHSLGAITTAVNTDAPPLLAWDKPGSRNPFCGYCHVRRAGGDFGLGAEATVLAVVDSPSRWSGGTHFPPGVVLVLKDARDQNMQEVGGALFPELLLPELRPVRATISAHSARIVMDQPAGQLAAGIVLRKDTPCNLRLAVQTGSLVRTFTIDRWE